MKGSGPGYSPRVNEPAPSPDPTSPRNQALAFAVRTSQ